MTSSHTKFKLNNNLTMPYFIWLLPHPLNSFFTSALLTTFALLTLVFHANLEIYFCSYLCQAYSSHRCHMAQSIIPFGNFLKHSLLEMLPWPPTEEKPLIFSIPYEFSSGNTSLPLKLHIYFNFFIVSSNNSKLHEGKDLFLTFTMLLLAEKCAWNVVTTQ